MASVRRRRGHACTRIRVCRTLQGIELLEHLPDKMLQPPALCRTEFAREPKTVLRWRDYSPVRSFPGVLSVDLPLWVRPATSTARWAQVFHGFR